MCSQLKSSRSTVIRRMINLYLVKAERARMAICLDMEVCGRLPGVLKNVKAALYALKKAYLV